MATAAVTVLQQRRRIMAPGREGAKEALNKLEHVREWGGEHDPRPSKPRSTDRPSGASEKVDPDR